MMILNRMKSSMVMAAMAVVMFASAACNDRPDPTPAEQLYEAARDGNETIDDLIARDAVITTQTVSEIMYPIGNASARFNTQLEAWQVEQPDPEYASKELTIHKQAGTLLDRLVVTLDTQGFAATVEGTGEETCDAPDTIDTSGTEIANTGMNDGATTDLGAVFTQVYWQRSLCKAACAAAGAVAAAACVPAGGVITPAVLVCLGLVAAAASLCNDECDGYCLR